MNDSLTQDLSWSHSKKIFFRFFFIFFGLIIIIQNNGAYPLWNFITYFLEEGLHTLIPWIGKNVLHLAYDITVFTNGSGDTTYDYVIVLMIFCIAIIGTILWSALDRHRAHYNTLYYWLTVAVRFYVGLMLINYGLVKIFKLQFPSPGLYRLTQAYGDSSPMGLAWTFLGFSEGYNLFMGLAEVGAILLLFRRTMTLGAIITLGTTANVMAINYFYDVPVKILSTTLFLMTAFLLSWDAERLYRLLLKGEAVSLPIIAPPQYKKRWLYIAGLCVKFLVIAYGLLFVGYQSYKGLEKYGAAAPKPKLYGLYSVNTFVSGKDTLAPLTTDSTRWRNFSVEYASFARVKHMNDSINGFILDLDTANHSLILTSNKDGSIRCSLRYNIPQKDKLILQGLVRGDSVTIAMTRMDEKKYRLIKRGFHWVNEYPYNR